MTDITSNPPRTSKGTSRRTSEFAVYFAIIFMLAIPFTTVSWLRDVFRRRTLFLHGPLARAWAEADRVTPTIFSA